MKDSLTNFVRSVFRWLDRQKCLYLRSPRLLQTVLQAVGIDTRCTWHDGVESALQDWTIGLRLTEW